MNLFFKDPESKPPARNQGSEPPSHVRSAPLVSQSFSTSTYPTPTPVPSLPLFPCLLEYHLYQVLLTTLILKMVPQSKYLWSTTSGENLHITMYLLLKVHVTSFRILPPQFPWLFWKVSFPHPPLPVATQGTAVLTNVTSCILGCT